jgi:YaiO family outer membrane protein
MTPRPPLRLAQAVLALVIVAGGASGAAAEEDDFRLEVGGFFAAYTGAYGTWFGAQSRFWLLDSTGTRGQSGYVDVIDLHWVAPAPTDARAAYTHSTFVLGRYLRSWHDLVYTFVTLGGTFDDPVFPQVQGELELNLIVPQRRSLVLTVGAGDRYFPSANRPYMLGGFSYALPRAAFIYRFWAGRGIALRASTTHLLTWAYGERGKLWVRLDLLWGDEAHVSPLAPLLSREADVTSKGLTLTTEVWLTKRFGLVGQAEVMEGTIEMDGAIGFHRWQAVVRPFWTF